MDFQRNKISFFITFFIVFTLNAQEFSVVSPNTNINVDLEITNKSCLTINYKGKKIIDEICIDVKTSDKRNFGLNPKVISTNSITSKENIKLDIPNKDKVIESEFNQLTVKFDQENELIIRVFNDGLAYRFVDNNPKSKNIIDEKMDLFFNDETVTYFPWEESMYSHNERLYNLTKVSSLKQGDFCSLPVMFKLNDVKVLFSESSLYNYPGMFLEKKSENMLSTKFPKYVLETKPAIFDPTIGDQIQIGAEDESDRTQKIVKEANYIAKLEGRKKLPWRVFIISDDDKTFVESNLITQLSESSQLEDTSWIKPGKVAWDWWNANNVYGVDFKAGINQETYKYYIDFASSKNPHMASHGQF